MVSTIFPLPVWPKMTVGGFRVLVNLCGTVLELNGCGISLLSISPKPDGGDEGRGASTEVYVD